MAKTIIIIDDEPRVRDVLKFKLEAKGYTVSIANNGEEGLEAIKSNKPDLVILDTILPGIDGFEVCKAIRKTKGIEGTKIIMTTSKIDALDPVTARMLGADDFVVKTLDFSKIIEAVKNIA